MKEQITIHITFSSNYFKKKKKQKTKKQNQKSTKSEQTNKPVPFHLIDDFELIY